MTASDKNKTVLLGVLIILAGLAWYFVYRPVYSTPAPETATKQAAKVKVLKAVQTRKSG
jgi:hypothetical protein